MTPRIDVLLGILLCTPLFLTSCGKSTGGAPNPTGGCTLDFPRHGICATVQWDTPPAVRRVTAGTLTFHRRTDPRQPVDIRTEVAGQLAVELDMPEHGHPGPDVTLAPGPNGTWRMTNVNFFMAGLWDVKVTLRGRSGNETAKISFTL